MITVQYDVTSYGSKLKEKLDWLDSYGSKYYVLIYHNKSRGIKILVIGNNIEFRKISEYYQCDFINRHVTDLFN